MIISIDTRVESFNVQQKYNSTKPSSASPLNGVPWHCHTGSRDGQVPLVRKENGAMKSSWATWGTLTASGEDKYVGHQLVLLDADH